MSTQRYVIVDQDDGQVKVVDTKTGRTVAKNLTNNQLTQRIVDYRNGVQR